MAEEPSAGVLAKLLTGEPLPLIPLPPQLKNEHELYNYIQRLHDYLRRMWGRFNGTNIFYEIVNNPPPEPPTGTQTTVAVDWRYDTATHRFQVKTRPIVPLFVGVESAWTDASGGQPVNASRVVNNVDYSTTTHIITEDHYADVYVLEKGALTTGTNIDSATTCAGL
jgi:hypothetical protein